MHFKTKIAGKNSEGGFVLVLALIGIMILMAIGYFALTVSTSDMQIATRIIGERKAMSAAEAGVHAVIANYESAPAANDTSGVDGECDDAGDWRQVDPDDPNAFYCVRGSQKMPGLSDVCTGAYSIEGGGYVCENYRSIIEGWDRQYDSRVSIDVGVKGKATKVTFEYMEN